MTEHKTKQLIGVNVFLLRGAQAMTIALVLSLRWRALETALAQSLNSGSSELMSHMLGLLMSLGIAISLTTVGVIYLHGKLTNTHWGRTPDVRRLELFHEMLAILIAGGLCWSLWPKLARSAYMGHHEILSQLISFGLAILMSVALVMLVIGGIYSLFLFRRSHSRQLESS